MQSFRKKFIVDLIISLVVLMALAGGLIFFGKIIAKTASQIVEARQGLVNKSSSLRFFAQLRKQYNDLAQNYLNIMYNIIPAKDQLINLSREFGTLANAEKLSYGFSFVEEVPVGNSNLGSVVFKINIAGESLDQLLRFVKRLQNFKYLHSLDGFSLDRQDQGLALSIKGRVFFR